MDRPSGKLLVFRCSDGFTNSLRKVPLTKNREQATQISNIYKNRIDKNRIDKNRIDKNRINKRRINKNGIDKNKIDKRRIYKNRIDLAKSYVACGFIVLLEVMTNQ